MMALGLYAGSRLYAVHGSSRYAGEGGMAGAAGEAGRPTLFPRAMLYISTRHHLQSPLIYEYRLPGALDADRRQVRLRV